MGKKWSLENRLLRFRFWKWENEWKIPSKSKVISCRCRICDLSFAIAKLANAKDHRNCEVLHISVAFTIAKLNSQMRWNDRNCYPCPSQFYFANTKKSSQLRRLLGPAFLRICDEGLTNANPDLAIVRPEACNTAEAYQLFFLSPKHSVTIRNSPEPSRLQNKHAYKS